VRAEHLRKALGSRRPSVRERAVEALGAVRAAGATALLIAQASDKNALVRARVAEALSSHPQRASERLLIHLLSDREELVRVNSAESLGKLGTGKAIKPLLEAAQYDRSPLVRAYAVESLGYLGVRTVRDRLGARLESEKSPAVLLRIVTALYRLGERKRWRDVIVFLDADDYRVRAAAAATLEELASPSRKAVIEDAIRRRLRSEGTQAVRSRLRSILRTLAS